MSPTPLNLKGLGAMDAPKPFKFTGFGPWKRSQKPELPSQRRSRPGLEESAPDRASFAVVSALFSSPNLGRSAGPCNKCGFWVFFTRPGGGPGAPRMPPRALRGPSLGLRGPPASPRDPKQTKAKNLRNLMKLIEQWSHRGGLGPVAL